MELVPRTVLKQVVPNMLLETPKEHAHNKLLQAQKGYLDLCFFLRKYVFFKRKAEG